MELRRVLIRFCIELQITGSEPPELGRTGPQCFGSLSEARHFGSVGKHSEPVGPGLRTRIIYLPLERPDSDPIPVL